MTHVLVIGGGVAGPVTGIALAKAGIEATVVEAHPTGADEAGAFLTLQSNGLDALRTVGAHHAVAGLGFPTPSIRMLSGTGRYLGEVPNGGALPDGTVSRTVRRADLYRALRDEATARGVRLEYGRRLVACAPDGDGVVATFADGTQVRADVLVGADGIRSTVRASIDPQAPPARYVPVLNVAGAARGVSTSAWAGESRAGESRAGEYCMVFGHRGFFGWTTAPDGETWWFANPPRRDEPAPGELAATTDAQWRRQLTELFAPDATPAVDLIRATEAPIRGWATYDVPRVPHWHAGRMVIVGDAAHATSPSSGQGASMAIEDAVVLARCLRDVPDVPAALATFTALRRDRVERVVKAGARTTNLKVAGPLGRRVRDAMMPLFLRAAAGTGMLSAAWMHEYHVDWDEPVVAVRN